MTYDILVVGGGPAGLAAAIAARGRDKSVLVIDGRSSSLAKAERVDNYPGLPGRSGLELLEEFYGHAQAAGAELAVGKALSLLAWDGFSVTAGSQAYRGRALILAPGAVRTDKYPGEAEYLGRGVSYCATCDGMLYRGRPVAVVGLAPDAPQEANYLSGLGCQVVYVSPQPPEGLAEGVSYVKAKQLAVRGEETVTGLEADGAPLPCAGVFILRPALAPTDLLPALETEGGFIKVDRRLATNVPGVFAAGDCTGGPLQVSKAVGEGHVAALSACEYLEGQKKGRSQ